MPNESAVTPVVLSQDRINTASDEALAIQTQQSNEAFTELYQRHHQSIYRYLLARTGNIEDAQDLTAQTFLAALENIASYRFDSVFAAWLFAIARHKLADYYRTGRAHLMLETAADLVDPADNPEQVTTRRLEMVEVALGLRNLNSDRADAITLRFFSGLSAVEIGNLMNKSEGAVKMLVHRALEDLRKHLSHKLEGE